MEVGKYEVCRAQLWIAALCINNPVVNASIDANSRIKGPPTWHESNSAKRAFSELRSESGVTCGVVFVSWFSVVGTVLIHFGIKLHILMETWLPGCIVVQKFTGCLSHRSFVRFHACAMMAFRLRRTNQGRAWDLT